MASRRVNKREDKRKDKREREAIAEPMEREHAPEKPTSKQASMPQNAAEMVRARAWEMHLRGIPKARIAQALSLDRGTVARYIAACYAEIAPEQKVSPARKLREAVARMRLVQEQAWDDHDADDEREQSVLALSFANTANTANAADDSDADWTQAGRGTRPDGKPGRTHADALDAKTHRSSSSSSNVSIRYQSQRSQYLRIILDAEKEIARLEGLYEGLVDVDAAVAVTFIQLSEEEVQRARARQTAQRGQIASSATLAGIPAPESDLPDGGESNG